MVTRFKLTPKSSNRKTGPIATTITSSDSCPGTCPFNNGGGCYAASGPLAIHWGKLNRRETGGDWMDLAHQVATAVQTGKLKRGTLLRHNVAGDLPHTDGVICAETLRHLAGTFSDFQLKAFTYTHHLQNGFNLPTIRQAIDQWGFTINLSCDSEAQASQRHREGFPSVCVVRSDDQRRSWVDGDGVRFQTCPAQLRDNVTCETCQLCTKADRACVVAFRAHGNGKRKVDKAVS